MPRRRYSKREEAQAVGIAAVEGQREAARKTGIPLTTIHQWFHDPEYEQLRTAKKEEVEQALWIGVQVGLKAVIDGFAGEGDLGKKATAFGIVFDKHALITGEATDRTEHRGLLADFDDHERGAARQWVLDQARKRLADAGS